MKYNLRSLMVAVLVGPPLLAGAYLFFQPILASIGTGALLTCLFYLMILLAPFLPAVRGSRP